MDYRKILFVGVFLLLFSSLLYAASFKKMLTAKDSNALADHTYNVFYNFTLNYAPNGILLGLIATNKYEEKQKLWIEGTYDGDTAYLSKINYYTLFSALDSSAKGVPICAAEPQYIYQNCATENLTKNHGGTIKFLDGSWAITNMNGPAKYPPYYKPPFDATYLYGSVGLSRVSIIGVIQEGESFEVNDDLVIKLENIYSGPSGEAAVFGFYKNNGTVLLAKNKIFEYTKKDTAVNKATYPIYVWNIFYDNITGSKFIYFALAAEELMLENGKPLQGYPDWTAYVGWSYGKKENEGTLKGVWISNTKGITLKTGDKIAIAKGGSIYLKYLGNGKFKLLIWDETVPSTVQTTLKEGEAFTTIAGYTIKVKGIYETIGQSANGNPQVFNKAADLEISYPNKATSTYNNVGEGAYVKYDELTTVQVYEINVNASCSAFNEGATCTILDESVVLKISTLPQ